MRDKRSGHSVLEFAFFLPYLLFLFVGTFDWGFYSWALLATENAARTAALYTSSSSSTASNSTAACAIATDSRMPRTSRRAHRYSTAALVRRPAAALHLR